MSQSIYKRKGNFKGFLFVLGLVIIALILLYTQHLVNLLQNKSREYLTFRLKVFEENINNPNNNTELGFFFSEVIQGTDFPIILTDTLLNPQSCRNISPEIDSLRTFTPELEKKLREMVNTMDEENPPIPIKYQGTTLNLYHFGESTVIQQLRWLPYIEISAAIIFILIGYIGFSRIKKSEERYIWIGMAKETAHQLGTPLSSIQGWIEILKNNPSSSSHALSEIEVDAYRLNKIAARFSQIGSYPAFKEKNIVKVLQNIVLYFQKRLPQFDKKLYIEEIYEIDPVLKINTELFEWVVENLIKNAVDAIANQKGKITVALKTSSDKKNIYIDISDTGKGISQRDKANVFKPGFSSKKRGWGLGLSLAKRIIEEYHKGKLYLKESRVGEGSVFRIILRNS
jgi:nitrogen-specific signal transduction histidine kinase